MPTTPSLWRWTDGLRQTDSSVRGFFDRRRRFYPRLPPMPYFLYPGTLALGEYCELRGVEVRHIRQARKIRVGEQISLQDQSMHRFLCQVEAVQNAFVRCHVLQDITRDDAIEFGIDLYLPLLKEKPLDLVLTKATELGARSVNLFQCNHSRRLPQGTVQESKLQRWQKIMIEACKQCERVSPPQLRCVGELEDILRTTLADMPALVFEVDGAIPLAEAMTAQGAGISADAGMNGTVGTGEGLRQEVALLIGPEAGFRDIQGLEPLPRISLGPRILRAETAAISVLALLQFLYGDAR